MGSCGNLLGNFWRALSPGQTLWARSRCPLQQTPPSTVGAWAVLLLVGFCFVSGSPLFYITSNFPCVQLHGLQYICRTVHLSPPSNFRAFSCASITYKCNAQKSAKLVICPYDMPVENLAAATDCRGSLVRIYSFSRRPEEPPSADQKTAAGRVRAVCP